MVTRVNFFIAAWGFYDKEAMDSVKNGNANTKRFFFLKIR